MAKSDQVTALREELRGALNYQIDEIVIYDEEEQDFIFKEEKVLTIFHVIGNRDVRKMRGALGETILHQVLLHQAQNPTLYRALARFFIKEYTELILLHYTGSHYYGETCLHIACIHNDVKMFKHLLECGANAADPRACGSFFMPYPQKKLRHALVSEGVMPRSVAECLHNLSTYCYFGEFLLGFAASSGQEELVELCLDHGCDINAQDTLGNTVLHIIVLSDNKYKNGCCARMFGLLQQRGADLNIKNDEGLTPLTTAAVLGNLKLFDDVLKMYRQTMWTYGPITCFSYNLCSLDLASSIKADDINVPNTYESDSDENGGDSDENEEDMVYAIKPEGSIGESVAVQKPSAPIVKITSKRKEARRSHPCRHICQQICRHCLSVHPPINTDLPSSESESSEDEFDETTGILSETRIGELGLALTFRRPRPRRFDTGMALAIHGEEKGKISPVNVNVKLDAENGSKWFHASQNLNKEEQLQQIRTKIEAGADPELRQRIELQKHANKSNEPTNVRPRSVSKSNRKIKVTRNHSSLGLLQHKHHRHRHHSWGRQVSALQVAIHLQHSELLQHPLLKHLLNDKWSAYARRWYHMSVAMMFVHVVAVTLAGCTWPTKYALEKHEQEFFTEAEDQSFLAHLWTFRITSMMALAGSAYLLLIEIYQMCTQGVVAYFIYYNMVENVLVLVHTVNVITAGILYARVGFTFWVNIFASIAVVFAWFLFLYKLRGLRHLGALIAMIEKIFRNDMTTFVPLYAVASFSFAQAFRVLFYSQNQIKISSHSLTDVNLESAVTFQSTDSYPEFMVLFKSSIGQAGEWNFERTTFPMYTQFLFVCFSILVTIVAMNLLIAMINFTFNRIYKEAEREWWLQRAEIILGYESNFSSHWHKFLVNSAAYVRNEVDPKTGTQSFSFIIQEEQDHWGHEKKKKTHVQKKWNQVIKRARRVSSEAPTFGDVLSGLNSTSTSTEQSQQMEVESQSDTYGPLTRTLTVRDEDVMIIEQLPM